MMSKGFRYLQTSLSLLMFNQLAQNSTESSDGFKVERTGRNELKYAEGSRSVIIEVEPGDGLAIYTSSIRSWVHGDETVSINREDVDCIVGNVCKALDFLRISYVVA